MTTEPAGVGPQPAARICPWCADPNAADATTCSGCGAALVEQTSEHALPGVDFVDPVAAAEAASKDRDAAGGTRVIEGLIEDLTGTDDPYRE